MYLTVSEVKVRQMPPKPFRERATNISADRTVEKRREVCREADFFFFTVKVSSYK